jgi:hypothetical protein
LAPAAESTISVEVDVPETCPQACDSDPTHRCYHDTACSEPLSDNYREGRGCNAGGRPNCRSCGFDGEDGTPYDECPAPEASIAALQSTFSTAVGTSDALGQSAVTTATTQTTTVTMLVLTGEDDSPYANDATQAAIQDAIGQAVCGSNPSCSVSTPEIEAAPDDISQAENSAYAPYVKLAPLQPGGRCPENAGGDITAKAECEAAAAELGLADTTAFVPGAHHQWMPAGCFYKPTNGGNKLYFNPNEHDDFGPSVCSHANQCICKGSAPGRRLAEARRKLQTGAQTNVDVVTIVVSIVGGTDSAAVDAMLSDADLLNQVVMAVDEYGALAAEADTSATQYSTEVSLTVLLQQVADGLTASTADAADLYDVLAAAATSVFNLGDAALAVGAPPPPSPPSPPSPPPSPPNSPPPPSPPSPPTSPSTAAGFEMTIELVAIISVAGLLALGGSYCLARRARRIALDRSLAEDTEFSTRTRKPKQVDLDEKTIDLRGVKQTSSTTAGEPTQLFAV